MRNTTSDNTTHNDSFVEIKELLGDSKYELLIMSAQGMNAAEIAERTGGRSAGYQEVTSTNQETNQGG